MAIQIQLRRGTAAQWTAANPVLAQGEMGVETDTQQFKIGNGTTAWNSLAYGGLQGAPGATGPAGTVNYAFVYGDGSDGDVEILSGLTTLTRDMYYNNLTVNGSGQINTNGYKIFVKNKLDITHAGSNAIRFRGNNGSAASNQNGGSAGALLTSNTVGGSFIGGAGATGVAGTGVTATATTVPSAGNGGASGAGGAGGNGSSGSGGTARAGINITTQTSFRTYVENVIRGATLIVGGASAPGGSSAAGNGSTSGRGGGGGGSGGGVIAIYAKTIERGSSTAASAISVKGGNGANGATSATADVGGGGGGGGAGGGYIYICYNELLGSLALEILDISGGDGANGGNGLGNATGGGGGNGGEGGRINTFNLLTCVATEVVGGPASAGSAASGTTGGNGGLGAISRGSL